uniref:Phosphatidate cytidylyltransferase, mitochondrial n=1 Tax=Sinocyclocheilus grahami TaxID=75366 RepID=A0A672Q5Z6_SINGR
MTPALQSSSVFYRRVLSRFPRDISLAFAYGSAVFRQTGGQMGKSMLDFVFAVDDPVTWHTMNLLENSRHYSFLRYLGPKHISSIQTDCGAAVYFNTLVPAEERVIKYGVISTDALIEDLLHWKTLYVAGRLHKPVRILLQSEHGKLRAALVGNLKSAVIASFLMLPESFSEEDLFLQIAGLSYSGDFRMVIGEDKSKVSNIVKENMPHFRKLYNSILQECPQVVYKPQQGISSIVKSSSITQSAKGIATAGLFKTVAYSARKLQKMWRGWRRRPS